MVARSLGMSVVSLVRSVGWLGLQDKQHPLKLTSTSHCMDLHEFFPNGTILCGNEGWFIQPFNVQFSIF